MAKKEQKPGSDEIQKSLDEKLDDIDKKFDVASIRKHYKVKLLARINKGEIGLLPELEQLEKLERGEMPNAPQPPLNLRGGAESGGVTADEYGIPDNLRIKRKPYTMTLEAFAQRKKAAKSKGKKDAMIGNKNAWKHGSHAQGFIRRIVKPCHSTCGHYKSCSAIKEGETEPGGVCVSGHNFLHVLDALQTAMQTKKFDALQEQASILIAGGFEVTRRMITEILEDNCTVRSEKRDKEGNIFYEIKNHPALPFLSKMLESQHLTIQDFMTTPLIIQKTRTEAKKVKTLGDAMSAFGLGQAPDDEDEIETGQTGQGEDEN